MGQELGRKSGTGAHQAFGGVNVRRNLERSGLMLELLAVLLVVMWLLGMVTSYTLSGFIHLLLVIALIAVILRIISGRPVL